MNRRHFNKLAAIAGVLTAIPVAVAKEKLSIHIDPAVPGTERTVVSQFCPNLICVDMQRHREQMIVRYVPVRDAVLVDDQYDPYFKAETENVPSFHGDHPRIFERIARTINYIPPVSSVERNQYHVYRYSTERYSKSYPYPLELVIMFQKTWGCKELHILPKDHRLFTMNFKDYSEYIKKLARSRKQWRKETASWKGKILK